MLTGKLLGQAIDSARKRKGVSKAQLARDFGVKAPSVQSWIERGTISKDKLMELTRYFNDVAGPEHWGEPALSNVVRMPAAKHKTDQHSITISRFDIGASMGKGKLAPEGYVDAVQRITVSKEYLTRAVSYSASSNLAMITGFGDSMVGTYSDGDLLLVDRGVTAIKLDAVYVLLYQGELFIKRIQRRPGANMLMISDNPAYPPIEITEPAAGNLEVLGRVLMVWNARKL